MLIPLRNAPGPLLSGLFRVGSLVCRSRPDRFTMSFLHSTLGGQDRQVNLGRPSLAVLRAAAAPDYLADCDEL
jgi:hypothetical protein